MHRVIVTIKSIRVAYLKSVFNLNHEIFNIMNFRDSPDTYRPGQIVTSIDS